MEIVMNNKYKNFREETAHTSSTMASQYSIEMMKQSKR